MSDSYSRDTKLLIGRKLSGRYVLTSLISNEEGTQTWLAKDLVLSRDVAVTLTNPFTVIDSIQISTFRKEAKAVSRVNHPSIVTVLDTTGDDDIEAIVIELVEEETIYEHVSREGPFATNQALQIIEQIADALSYAHREGIIHGNLSPKKVFLCPDRGPKVTGFGFTEFRKLAGSQPVSDENNTSLFQSSSEIDTQEATVANDIFSLGKLLGFMLYGLSQSPGKDRLKTGKDKRIYKSIQKATAGEQTERYSRVVDFIDDLDQESTDEEANTDRNTSSQPSKSFDSNTLITKFLLTGFVFFFVLGIIFAANGNPFSSDNESIDPVSPEIASNTNDLESSQPTVVDEEQVASENTESSNLDSDPELSESEVSPIFEMVSVIGASDFDPLGDGVEHPELIDNLLDEDPATIWYSETYANRAMGGLKDGVGVVIELKKPYELQKVIIETVNTGWSGEVYVSDSPETGLASWGTSVGSISASQGNATVDLSEITGGAVLIWFTDLGDKPPPGIRMEISEIEVS